MIRNNEQNKNKEKKSEQPKNASNKKIVSSGRNLEINQDPIKPGPSREETYEPRKTEVPQAGSLNEEGV